MHIITTHQFHIERPKGDRLIPDGIVDHRPEKPGIRAYNKFVGAILALFHVAVKFEAKGTDGQSHIWYINVKSFNDWKSRENLKIPTISANVKTILNIDRYLANSRQPSITEPRLQDGAEQVKKNESDETEHLQRPSDQTNHDLSAKEIRRSEFPQFFRNNFTPKMQDILNKLGHKNASLSYHFERSGESTSVGEWTQILVIKIEQPDKKEIVAKLPIMMSSVGDPEITSEDTLFRETSSALICSLFNLELTNIEKKNIKEEDFPSFFEKQLEPKVIGLLTEIGYPNSSISYKIESDNSYKKSKGVFYQILELNIKLTDEKSVTSKIPFNTSSVASPFMKDVSEDKLIKSCLASVVEKLP